MPKPLYYGIVVIISHLHNWQYKCITDNINADMVWLLVATLSRWAMIGLWQTQPTLSRKLRMCMSNRLTAQYKHAGKKQRFQCQSLYEHSKTGLKDKSRGLSNQSANALSIYRTQQLNAFKEKGAKHLRNRKWTSKNWIRSTFGFVQVDLFGKRNLNMILWLRQGLH